MKKKELLNGDQITLTSEDHILEAHWSDHLGKFCIWFNGKLETFKSFSGFNGRIEKLTDKFCLTEPENI